MPSPSKSLRTRDGICVLGIGRDQDGGFLVGIRKALFPKGLRRLGIDQDGGKAELVLQFALPLLAERCGADDEDPALAFGPELAHHKARLDRLAEAHLVRQENALRERRAQGKERRLDLMRIQVDRRVQKRLPKTVEILAAFPRQGIREELCLIGTCAVFGCQIRSFLSPRAYTWALHVRGKN